MGCVCSHLMAGKGLSSLCTQTYLTLDVTEKRCPKRMKPKPESPVFYCATTAY